MKVLKKAQHKSEKLRDEYKYLIWRALCHNEKYNGVSVVLYSIYRVSFSKILFRWKCDFSLSSECVLQLIVIATNRVCTDCAVLQGRVKAMIIDSDNLNALSFH